mgnify:CR=1 FL=1
MSLVANLVEEAGIVTVVAGSARDIVEEVGVPRFLFTDFPLGSPLGRPDAPEDQLENLRAALTLAASAWAPRTTVQSPQVWGENGWRERFMRIDDPEALAREGEARRARQASEKA